MVSESVKKGLNEIIPSTRHILIFDVTLFENLQGAVSFHKQRDTSAEALVEFKAMIIAVLIHSILLFFELFLCYQVCTHTD